MPNSMLMKLFASMGFSICAFIFLLLVLIMYLSKKKFKSFDSSVFISMFILTFIILINEFLYVYAMYVELDKNTIFIPVRPLCYTYILLSVIWFACLIVYIWSKSKKDKSFDKIKREKAIIITSLSVVSILLFVILLFLGIEYPASNSNLYVFSGTGVYVLYTVAIISLLIVVLTMIVKKNNIPSYQKYPIYFCLFILVVVNGLQMIFNYDFNVLSFLFAFIITTLYFTIESQDYKLINELEQKSKESQIASISKTRFLDNMSHKIRTPLNTIMNFSNALLSEDKNSKEQIEKYGRIISYEINELNEIISNILDISNIESNKLEIQNHKYDIEEFVCELSKSMKALLVNKATDFKVEIDSNITKKYIGDYQKILKILFYIIESVINNTEYGHVFLKISSKDLNNNEKELHYNIVSLGNKMSKETFDTLFDNFKTIHTKSNDLINNTNLKLIVAKEYLDLLDGKLINIDSKEGSNYDVIINQIIDNK